MIFVPTEFEKFTADIRERMFLCPQKSVMRRMNNLLLLTRKEVHTQRLGFEFFDVIFSAAVIAAAEQGIVITVEIEEDICAEADRQVLECVLMNVLSNACAFSADSRVKVTVFLNEV